jgi:hypothetical protein
MGVEQISEVIAELDAIGERIADISLDLLHAALGDSDPKASPSAKAEKLVTRARRSVEKARHLLSAVEEAQG